MIRCVILDLGRVLVPFDFKIGYRLMSEHCGLQPEECYADAFTSEADLNQFAQPAGEFPDLDRAAPEDEEAGYTAPPKAV